MTFYYGVVFLSTPGHCCVFAVLLAHEGLGMSRCNVLQKPKAVRISLRAFFCIFVRTENLIVNLKLKQNRNLNRHYTRGITPKRAY